MGAGSKAQASAGQVSGRHNDVDLQALLAENAVLRAKAENADKRVAAASSIQV